eukprot:COSAG02_NODE_20999_length_806_cov_9.117397_1_plen_230_part_01
MTSFAFEKNFPNDFKDSDRGSVGSGWEWISKVVSTDSHTGVIQQRTGTGGVSVTTPCMFETLEVVIEMDVLPRKHTVPSTLGVSIGGVTYATLDIPSSADATTQSNCTVITSSNTTSNLAFMMTGIESAQTLWTDGWKLKMTLPASVLDEAWTDVSLTHSTETSGGTVSFISIDNLNIVGAICGTGHEIGRDACVCEYDNPFAQRGEQASTSTAFASPVESFSDTAATPM